MNPVWKLKKILFNIEGYGEFFSGITPIKIILNALTQLLINEHVCNSKLLQITCKKLLLNLLKSISYFELLF